MSRRIIDSYKKKLAGEEGFVVKRGASLRVALCYPNTHAIGMANLGLHTMYELFNKIPEVSCERVFLPDAVDLKEYERSRTPLLSLETQTPVRDFDVVAFSISFETDYLNMARMLQLSGVPVWSKDRNDFHPLVVMGGAASFLNPEPIADFTDVIAVGEGEILAFQLVDAILESSNAGVSPAVPAASRRRDEGGTPSRQPPGRQRYSSFIFAEYIRHARCSSVAPSTTERRRTYSPLKFCSLPSFVEA